MRLGWDPNTMTGTLIKSHVETWTEREEGYVKMDKDDGNYEQRNFTNHQQYQKLAETLWEISPRVTRKNQPC